MPANQLIIALVFLGVAAGVIGLVSFTARPRGERRLTRSRLQELAREGQNGARTSPHERLLSATPIKEPLLRGLGSPGRASLQQRLARAGFKHPHALTRYITIRMVLMIALPLAVGLSLFALGWLSERNTALAAVGAGAVSFVAPGLWLEHRIHRRKRTLRRGLPDALDMMVLCLEGGLSLRAALQRVTGELDTVHPLLASEMQLMQSKMQLGLSAGEAMKQFADDADLEGAQQLSAVLIQSERFGASTSKSLRMHADSFRHERQHNAEEMAQKAAVKILFPTLLCIFPAIFIVILGPAAVQIAQLFSK